jgi:hypothetical protein
MLECMDACGVSKACMNSCLCMHLCVQEILAPGNTYRRGRISMIDFLVLTSPDQQRLVIEIYSFFYKKLA